MARFYVKVTNQNDFDLDDHFDGVHYVFPSGKSTQIPFDAACHIFGIESPEELNDKDKLLKFMCQRWGWNTPETVKEKKHIEHFNKIKIVLVSYKVVQDGEDSDEDGVLPASRVNADRVDARPASNHPLELTAPEPKRRGRPPMNKTVDRTFEDTEDESMDGEAA